MSYFKRFSVNELIMARKRFKAVRLDISHHDCFGSQLTERFPEVSMKIVSDIHLLKKSGTLVGYQVVVEVIAPNVKELESFFKALRNHPKYMLTFPSNHRAHRPGDNRDAWL